MLRRAAPLLAIGGVAFIVGVVNGAGYVPGAQRAADRFAQAWQRGDYAAMYALLDNASHNTTSPGGFADAYRTAAATATTNRLIVGHAKSPSSGKVVVPMHVSTRVFGQVAAPLTLPVHDEGDSSRIAWTPALVFPGMNSGERLTRATQLPARASLLARDGTPMASLGLLASGVTGSLGPIPADKLRQLRAQGVPADAQVGTSGLQAFFQTQLAGHPGGRLMVGARTIARSAPRASRAVRTSIDPSVQRAAVTALGGRLGGVIALKPSTGEVLGQAGIATNDTQPAGSTFKMITVTGVLEAKLATPKTVFPYATQALLSGVPLQNAGQESCGGTLTQAFADSCNSVFAPLGAKLGGPRLSNIAQRFGFNHPPGLPGALESTLPQGDKIGDDLAVGSTAIGQGEVAATALAMGIVATTIADKGRRPIPTYAYNPRPVFVRVTTPAVARIVRMLMVGVVRFGTGTSAAIPGVVVAGKTGTAELTQTQGPGANSSSGGPSDTDAWFAAFAPARQPRISVGVMLVKAGAGGDTAAPVAHDVLVAGLARR